jgi:hypothetical protein
LVQTDHFRFDLVRLIEKIIWKNRYNPFLFHVKGKLMPTNGEDG